MAKRRRCDVRETTQSLCRWESINNQRVKNTIHFRYEKKNEVKSVMKKKKTMSIAWWRWAMLANNKLCCLSSSPNERHVLFTLDCIKYVKKQCHVMAFKKVRSSADHWDLFTVHMILWCVFLNERRRNLQQFTLFSVGEMCFLLLILFRQWIYKYFRGRIFVPHCSENQYFRLCL